MNNYISQLKDITYDNFFWPLTYFYKDSFTQNKLDLLIGEFFISDDKDSKVAIFNCLKQHRYKVLKSTEGILFKILPAFFTSYRTEKVNMLTTALKTMQTALKAQYNQSFINPELALAQERFDEFLDHAPTEQEVKSAKYQLYRNNGVNYFYWWDKAFKVVRQFECSNTNIASMEFTAQVVNKVNQAFYEGGDPIVRWAEDSSLSIKDKKLIYVDSKGLCEYYSNNKWYKLQIPDSTDENLRVGWIKALTNHVKNHGKWKNDLKTEFQSHYTEKAPNANPKNGLEYYIRPRNNRRFEVDYYFPTLINNENKWAFITIPVEDEPKGLETLKTKIQLHQDARRTKFIIKLNLPSVNLNTINVTLNHLKHEYLAPTEKGVTKISKEIKYQGLSQSQIIDFLTIPAPKEEDLNTWRQQADALRKYCTDTNLLYTSDALLKNNEIKVCFTDYPYTGYTTDESPSLAKYALPIVHIVWRDVQGQTHKREIDSLDPSKISESIKAAEHAILVDELNDKMNSKNVNISVDTKNHCIHVSSSTMTGETPDKVPVSKAFSVKEGFNKELLFSDVENYIQSLDQQYQFAIDHIRQTFDTCRPKNKESASDKLTFSQSRCTFSYYDFFVKKTLTKEFHMINYHEINKEIKATYTRNALCNDIMVNIKNHQISANMVLLNNHLSTRITKNILEKHTKEQKVWCNLALIKSGNGFEVLYRPSSKPNILLSYPIHETSQIDDFIKTVKFDNALLEVFETSKKNVYETISTHIDIQVPDEIPGVNLNKIKDYFKLIDFANPASPNHLSLSNIGIYTSNKEEAELKLKDYLKKAEEKLIQFYDHLEHPSKLKFITAEQDKCAKTLKNLLSNIIHLIEQEPDHKTRLLQVSQVIMAICYCDTKWMMALMDQYALLKGVLEGASLEDCNVLQVAQSWVDAVKYKRYHAMVSEIYYPENEAEKDIMQLIGQQQEHHKKWVLSCLSKQGHKIPLANIADFQDIFGTYSEYCNYKTEHEVKHGFEDGFIIALVHDFHERLSTAFATDMKFKISAQVKDRIAHYLKNLAKAPEKLMLSVHKEKFDPFLPELQQVVKDAKETKLKKIQNLKNEITDPKTASERCDQIRNDLLNDLEAKLIKELHKTSWSVEKIGSLAEAYIKAIKTDPKGLHDESVIKQLINDFLKNSKASFPEQTKLTSLAKEFAVNANAIMSKKDSEYLLAYEKERLVEIKKDAQINLSIALQMIGEKIGLFVEDEDTGAVTSISLEGTLAAVFGFGFADPIK